MKIAFGIAIDPSEVIAVSKFAVEYLQRKNILVVTMQFTLRGKHTVNGSWWLNPDEYNDTAVYRIDSSLDQIHVVSPLGNCASHRYFNLNDDYKFIERLQNELKEFCRWGA